MEAVPLRAAGADFRSLCCVRDSSPGGSEVRAGSTGRDSPLPLPSVLLPGRLASMEATSPLLCQKTTLYYCSLLKAFQCPRLM